MNKPLRKPLTSTFNNDFNNKKVPNKTFTVEIPLIDNIIDLDIPKLAK